ncbi:AAC(3) family N-acetyltransferase [Spirochaeta lutea]|uniref:Aminoglycoside N(3)-acetyltransferase n=1 Tax=Spirochaeta lutea TaxID=1480694 RepID=A0A098R389_9SPIO|nr:AAC(3) family N-acetyltransferase [Spirochaeta lutea]KGE73192.1 hypothetical protein DC28_05320 [Spirochaeta lutea]
MHTKMTLKGEISKLGIDPEDRLLIHSSMKALGEVEGGADTVLDAFIEYLAAGLLMFPTHTWKQVGETNPVFDPKTDASCVGILTNLFMKRPGVFRSLHPTHSVAAIGRDAESYTKGEELTRTACPRSGCWGRLVDIEAKILFLGCSMRSNTLIHGVEEWMDIPDRLSPVPQPLKVRTEHGLVNCPQYRHQSRFGDVSQTYGKLEKPLLNLGAATEGYIGDARCILVQVTPMVDFVQFLLEQNPRLFQSYDSVPEADVRRWRERSAGRYNLT